MSKKGKGRILVRYNKENFPIPIYEASGIHIRLHSLYSTKEESEDFFREYYNPEMDTYIFWGLGFGYHICNFMKKKIKIHVIVLNEELLQKAKDYDTLKVEGQALLEFHCIDQVDRMDDILGWMKTEYAVHIFHMPSIRLFQLRDKTRRGFIVESMMTRLNAYAMVRERMEENMKRNEMNYDEGVGEFISKIKSKAILIAAAGPSLKEDMEWLRKYRDYYYLLSVGTCLKYLISEELVPDAVIVTDASEKTFQQLYGVEDSRIALVALATTYYRNLEYWKGTRILAYSSLGNPKNKDENVNALRTGGSVATTALDLAVRTSASLIVFAGLNLSYPNNISHIENTPDYREISKTSLTVEDYEGVQQPSSKSLVIYRDWIASRAKTVTDKTFLNCTSKGARIEGIPYCNERRFQKEINKLFG